MISLLDRLPTELVENVLQHVDNQEDRLSCCLVSRDFNKLGAPVLYNDVLLRFHSPASFLAALHARPDKAALVRELDFMLSVCFAT